MKVSMKVNGTAYEHDVEPRTLLVQHLRENMGLTGTHVGCDTSSCGACTIIVNGETVKSCTLLAVQCRWCGNKDYRRYGNKRRTSSYSGKFPGKARVAVRILHSRYDHVFLAIAGTQSKTIRR